MDESKKIERVAGADIAEVRVSTDEYIMIRKHKFSSPQSFATAVCRLALRHVGELDVKNWIDLVTLYHAEKY